MKSSVRKAVDSGQCGQDEEKDLFQSILKCKQWIWSYSEARVKVGLSLL